MPAKKAAPPWDSWRMMGDLESLAASRDETTVEEEVTLMAGMANFFSWQYLKSVCTSSPLPAVSVGFFQHWEECTDTITPDFLERLSVAPILNIAVRV